MPTPLDRARFYNQAFPERPPVYCEGYEDAHVLELDAAAVVADSRWICGTWCIGACYANPNPLYGAYPRGYLERIHSMFPEARNILHVFSGGLTLEAAVASASFRAHTNDDYDIELVDLHGPEKGRYPTWQGDVHLLPLEWKGRFDLILADPPYSAEDAFTYEVPMIVRRDVMRSLHSVCKRGGNLVWLDTQWPMHRKSQWRTWGHIGLVRSTQHRVRLISMFEAQ
jgi:hypothetical protein